MGGVLDSEMWRTSLCKEHGGGKGGRVRSGVDGRLQGSGAGCGFKAVLDI